MVSKEEYSFWRQHRSHTAEQNTRTMKDTKLEVACFRRAAMILEKQSIQRTRALLSEAETENCEPRVPFVGENDALWVA